MIILSSVGVVIGIIVGLAYSIPVEEFTTVSVSVVADGLDQLSEYCVRVQMTLPVKEVPLIVDESITSVEYLLDRLEKQLREEKNQSMINPNLLYQEIQILTALNNAQFDSEQILELLNQEIMIPQVAHEVIVTEKIGELFFAKEIMIPQVAHEVIVTEKIGGLFLAKAMICKDVELSNLMYLLKRINDLGYSKVDWFYLKNINEITQLFQSLLDGAKQNQDLIDKIMLRQMRPIDVANLFEDQFKMCVFRRPHLLEFFNADLEILDGVANIIKQNFLKDKGFYLKYIVQ